MNAYFETDGDAAHIESISLLELGEVLGKTDLFSTENQAKLCTRPVIHRNSRLFDHADLDCLSPDPQSTSVLPNYSLS